MTEIHVNLANNNMYHEQGYGLNPNKRGKIKESDLEELRNAELTDSELQRNRSFGIQDQNLCQKFIKKKEYSEKILGGKREAYALANDVVSELT
jgi:hypothetical protein